MIQIPDTLKCMGDLEICYYIFYKPARELSLIHSILFKELLYIYHNLSKSSLKSRSKARGVTKLYTLECHFGIFTLVHT